MIQQPKQDDEEIDKKLLELAKKFKTLIDEHLERAKKGLEVLLLVGNTGAGKSTIFNFLAGADFDFDEKDLLKIKNNEKQNMNEKFSLMNSGMQSVTKEPKYYFNEEKNHLLIDFPGFKDTKGVLDQLMIQMLFLKIVTLSPTKIIYVIRSPERKLPERGESLQSFIHEQFQGQTLDSSKFTLLLNSYQDKLSEEKLVNNVKEDLGKIQNKPNDNIFVLRKVDDEETLQKNFTIKKRDDLWEKLINSNKIEFSPKTLPCSGIVSEYVRKHTSSYIQKHFELFDQTMFDKGSELTEIILNKIILLIEQLIEIVITIDKQQIIASYCNFMEKFQEIITFITRKAPQLLLDSKDFMQVFKFYSQFSTFINGYQECLEELINSKNQCELMKLTVNEKLQLLKEKKEQEEKIRQQQQEQEEKIRQQQQEYEEKIRQQQQEQEEKIRQQQQEQEEKIRQQQQEYEERIRRQKEEDERIHKQKQELEERNRKLMEENYQKSLELERERYQRQLDSLNYSISCRDQEISSKNSQISSLKKSKKSSTQKKKPTQQQKFSSSSYKKNR